MGKLGLVMMMVMVVVILTIIDFDFHIFSIFVWLVDTPPPRADFT
jgi:hypothetical protein